MKNAYHRTKKYLAVASLALFSMSAAVAQAEILYDGADTSGVTTDDQYIIDYDETSGGNIDLQFGNAANYLRYDVTSGGKFLLSDDLDMQSNQLLNARVQNVSLLANVPSCSAAGDRGKKIFVGAGNIAGVNGAQTLEANKEYICNDTNSAATRWVATTGGDATTLDGLDSTQFLRSDTSDNYTSGTLTFDAATGVVFNTNNVTLPGTTSNTFNVNNDAANGDSSVLSFGDGTGTLTFDDTTGVFSTSNSLTVTGTATANSLVVNSGGSIDLNNNQVQDLRLENLAALPGAPTVGRLVYLTANDTTAPGCSVTVPCTAGAYYFNGTKWVRESADGASATLEFSPQFKDGVVRPDNVGANNVGTMSTDTDTSNNRNYYRWTTNKNSLQDIDVVVDTRLPDDFGGFAASNALQYDIRANDTVNTNTKLDIEGKDTAGTAMTISGTVTGVVPTAANTWESKSHNITGGTYDAGSRIQLTFKLSALRSGSSRMFDLGNFRLNYVRKNP